MYNITIAVGSSKLNSKMGTLTTALSWGPKLNEKVDSLVTLVLNSIRLPTKLKNILEVTIKNYLRILIEESIKYGHRSKPKLHAVECSTTRKTVKFKLSVR